MDNFDKLKQQIESAQTIAVLTHVNPDGDTLGSALALKFAIENVFAKKPNVVLNSHIPEIYKFLPGINETVHTSKLNLNKQYDLAIAVDIASKERMGHSLPIFQNAKVTVNIDHHVTNNDYGAINYNCKSVSSTGELIYNILRHFEWDIDKNIATALYTAVCTDTGNFRYENTSAATLKTASELVRYGAVPFEVSRYCYGSKPKAMVMLSAFCINNAVFLENDKIVYSVLTDADMKKMNAENDFTEGIVETLREIKTTDVAILFKEVKSDQTKVSLRSKTIDVSEISAKFDGGGHKHAAGCTINKPVKIAVEKILDTIKEKM